MLETVPTIEDLIARHGLRRASEDRVQPALPTGHALDAHLPGGGLPRAALTEILTPISGIGELALLLRPLAEMTAAHRRIAFVDPPHVPYAPALAGAGIDLRRTLAVRAATPAANLWAAEQMLRSPLFGAVLCWTPAAPKALRRLQVAAEAGGGVGVLYSDARQAANASMAALRLHLTPVTEGVEATVLKCRGPAGARVRCSLALDAREASTPTSLAAAG